MRSRNLETLEVESRLPYPTESFSDSPDSKRVTSRMTPPSIVKTVEGTTRAKIEF